jgi:hypothetical protein
MRRVTEQRPVPTRRSRMRRKRTGKHIELSERDIELFRLLDRYRYLRSNFLYAFFGGASETRFKERLGDLYHEGGYIDRPRQQWQYANCRSMPIVYELGNAGAQVLREHGSDERDSPLLAHGRAGACRQFAHAVMISDIMASVELAVRENPSLRFIGWQEILAKAPPETRRMANPFAVPVTISHTFSGAKKLETVRTKIVPDGLFGLEYRGGGQKSYRFFALEADRATMPVVRGNLRQTSFLKKILGYRELASRQLYQTQLGLPNLLVLAVTTNERHSDSMLTLVRELTGGSKMFLFKTMSSLGDFQEAPIPTAQFLMDPWRRAGFWPIRVDAPS